MKGEEIYKENDKIIDNVTYICCYDFLEKDDYYIFCGKRSLSIGDSEAYTKYSWQETMLADMFISKSFLYKKAIQKKYNALPAWGVSDNSKIESVTVDGQKIDEVHTIDVDGKEYYLWIIYDLQTENKSADVVIEEN